MARIWIMDGHNLIFAVQDLQEMQVSGRGAGARGALADTLRRFAQTRGEQVLVVFDGRAQSEDTGVIRESFFETVYTRRGEGAADERIIREAGSRAARGQHVTVVTNDLRTLAVRLPKSVHHMKVREFWLKHIERAGDAEGKRVEGDFSDVERAMQAQAPLDEIEVAPGARSGEIPPAHSAPSATTGHTRRRKERGRLRQARRLERRAKPGRRR